MDDSRPIAPFAVYGPLALSSPVLLTVPHAGRHYPQALIDNARVDMGVLRRLEDRHADALIDLAVDGGTNAMVAHYARAWIDLNRAETAWDSALVADATPSQPADRKVRAGLGLIPRQLSPEGPLLLRRLTFADVTARLERIHRPWHRAIADALAARARRFDAAVLLDLHSMPTPSGGTPQIVIGDRYGLTASMALVDRVMAVVEGFGFAVARNIPYAGAYAIERHGKRSGPIEAIQIEIDRALYLGADGQLAAGSVGCIRQLVAALSAAAVAHCHGGAGVPLAAE